MHACICMHAYMCVLMHAWVFGHLKACTCVHTFGENTTADGGQKFSSLYDVAVSNSVFPVCVCVVRGGGGGGGVDGLQKISSKTIEATIQVLVLTILSSSSPSS